MKAPDKIYLCADAPRIYDWSRLPFEKGGNIEYIRKDALIEWMDKNIKDLNALFGEIFIAKVKDKLKQL